MEDLSGTATFVTGGARGIGRGIALSFAKAGSNVVIGDLLDRSDIAEHATQTVSACRELGVKAEAVHVDVREEATLSAAAQNVKSEFGPLTTVVANAGVISSGRVQDMELADWQNVLDVNLTGAWLTCKAFVPMLIENAGGSVVVISSVAAYRGADGYAAYCAAKSGLLGMSRALSHELASANVRINVVAPGYLGTDMWFKGILGGVDAHDRETHAAFSAIVDEAVPLGRPQTPADIGDAAVFLASSTNTTGAELIVDGGRIAGP